MRKESYRTTQPFSGGLSPTTDKSKAVPMFGGTPLIQDIINGDDAKATGVHGGGSWSEGKDISNSYREEGDEFMRHEQQETKEREKALSRHRREQKSEWVVEMEDGSSRTFESYPKAVRSLQDTGEPYRRIFRKEAQISNPSIIAKALQSCVTILSESKSGKELGAGFCISPRVFVTCAHVVKRYDKISIPEDYESNLPSIFVKKDTKVMRANILSIDPQKDIAILTSDLEIPVAELAESITLPVGDDVFVIGAPKGFEDNVSQGIISAKNRKVFTHEGSPSYMFTDAHVLPGNSGGPMILYRSGKIIGMMALIVGGNGGMYGLNAAIPSEYIASMLEDLGISAKK